MHTFYLLFLCFVAAAPLLSQCPDLVWSDEFDGESLNPDNWTYEIGDGCDRGICGWGNQELQYYQEENTTVSDGILTITARPEAVGNSTYTSSRLISRYKQDFRYGRMEARVKVPGGLGTWPAFWMLATDTVYGGWPQSGEIDIMEYVGREPNQVLGTIHYGQPWPNNRFNSNAIDFDEPVADDFHEFAVEWEEDEIRWFVDGILYATETPADLGDQHWPFDQDSYFILNLAVGGTLGGPVDPAAFPAELQFDYVRVYGGDRPFITGEREVANRAGGVEYRVGSIPEGATVNWTIPEGATFSGQGTSAIIVDWGTTGGKVTATTTLACGEQTLSTEVHVAAAYERQRSLENFDDERELTFDFATGVLTETDNPDPDTLVPASRIGSYERAAGTPFDVLIYEVNTIPDASLFVDGTQRFYIDVYTTAPVGTPILLQLESGEAAGDNYPTGRHSRYQAETTVQNAWERIYLPYLDRPDPTVPDDAVSSLILLFAPNGSSGDTFNFDNLDVYAEQTTGLFFPSVRADFPLSASPNPVGETLRLRFPSCSPVRIDVEVYDSAGKQMLGRTYDRSMARGGKLTLPVTDLPSGIYMARLRLGTEAASVRFVR